MDEPSPSDPSNNLGWSNVALGLSFIIFNAFISGVLGLDVGGSLVTAALRCVLQLSLMALLLQRIFDTDNPWVSFSYLCFSKEDGSIVGSLGGCGLSLWVLQNNRETHR